MPVRGSDAFPVVRTAHSRRHYHRPCLCFAARCLVGWRSASRASNACGTQSIPPARHKHGTLLSITSHRRLDAGVPGRTKTGRASGSGMRWHLCLDVVGPPSVRAEASTGYPQIHGILAHMSCHSRCYLLHSPPVTLLRRTGRAVSCARNPEKYGLSFGNHRLGHWAASVPGAASKSTGSSRRRRNVQGAPLRRKGQASREVAARRRESLAE